MEPVKKILGRIKYKKNDKRGECVCGHNHTFYVEDLGEWGDEEGYDVILECAYCGCENFRRKY